jgi:hypothetical protein
MILELANHLISSGGKRLRPHARHGGGVDGELLATRQLRICASTYLGPPRRARPGHCQSSRRGSPDRSSGGLRRARHADKHDIGFLQILEMFFTLFSPPTGFADRHGGGCVTIESLRNYWV